MLESAIAEKEPSEEPQSEEEEHSEEGSEKAEQTEPEAETPQEETDEPVEDEPEAETPNEAETAEPEETQEEPAPQMNEEVASTEQEPEQEPEQESEPEAESIPHREPEPEEASTPEPEPTVMPVQEPAVATVERHDTYGDDRNERTDRGGHTLNTILIAFLALLAGLLIGYFGHGMLNLNGVKSVNISAEDVQVIHQTAQTEEHEPEAENRAITTLPEEEEAVTAEDAPASTDNGSEAETAPAQTLAPAVTAKATPAVTDTVKAGRFLTTMAQRHYGKKKFWVYIYLENAGKLGDPDLIPPMTVVTIPPLEKYGVNANDKASEEDAEQKAIEILSRYCKN